MTVLRAVVFLGIEICLSAVIGTIDLGILNYVLPSVSLAVAMAMRLGIAEFLVLLPLSIGASVILRFLWAPSFWVHDGPMLSWDGFVFDACLLWLPAGLALLLRKTCRHKDMGRK